MVACQRYYRRQERLDLRSLRGFTFSDPSVRLARETDASPIAQRFCGAYADEYPFRDVYDGTWLKSCVHSDDAICVVLELCGDVIATCAVILNRGDHNDQLGELARLVVHKVHKDDLGRGAGPSES
jgi:hypothetical protein